MAWKDAPWRDAGQCPADWFAAGLESFLTTPEAIMARAIPWRDLVAAEHIGGIYFLIDDADAEISYVGISGDIQRRVNEHLKRKRFSRVYAHSFPQVMAEHLEEFYIAALNPRDNSRERPCQSPATAAALAMVKDGILWPGWTIPEWEVVIR